MLPSQLHSQNQARRIEAELEVLAKIVVLPTSQTNGPASEWWNFSGFWQKAREISELFRLSDLVYEDRTRLWRQHQEICEQVNRFRLQQRKARQEASEASRVQVMSILEDVHKSLSVSATESDFLQVRSKLGCALAVMKDSFLLRNTRQECWEAWHEADRELVRRRRQTARPSASRRHRTLTDPALTEAIESLSRMCERKTREREKLLADIESLQEEIRKSLRLEWAARAKVWLGEKRLKAEELKRDLEELEHQIQSLKGRLNI